MKLLPLLLAALLLSTAGVARADDAFERAKQSYQAGKYADVAAALEREPAAGKDAKSQYLLGLAQLKLREYAKARVALLAARRLDPKLGFTKKKAKFAEKLARAERLAKAAAAPRPEVPGRSDADRVAAPSPRLAFATDSADPTADARRGLGAPSTPSAPSASSVPAAAPVRASSSGGAPLWALILLGLCGAFLVVSFLRQLRSRAR